MMSEDPNDPKRAPERKPWRTPVVITTTIDETEAGATPLVTEGAFAFGS